MTTFRIRAANDRGDVQIEELDVLSAKALLESGKGALDEHQKDPPTELLELLETCVEKVERLGPETDAPKRLQKVSERLFVNGLMQLVADGHQLNWHHGYRAILAAIEVQLSACSDQSVNLFAQFRRLYRHKVASEPALIASGGSDGTVIEEVLRKQGLVPDIRDGVFIAGEPPQYKRVGQEWRAFHERFMAVEDSLLETVELAFDEGRVICAEAASKGDRLVPPSLTKPLREHRRRKDIHYLLSRELPRDWFSDVDTLPKRRKQAISWINHAGNHFASLDRRASSNDLKSVAMEKFGLTKHAVAEIWDDCQFSGKSAKGSIAAQQRVSINEIREIE